jgi:hypothetical protein
MLFQVMRIRNMDAIKIRIHKTEPSAAGPPRAHPPDGGAGRAPSQISPHSTRNPLAFSSPHPDAVSDRGRAPHRAEHHCRGRAPFRAGAQGRDREDDPHDPRGHARQQYSEISNWFRTQPVEVHNSFHHHCCTGQLWSLDYIWCRSLRCQLSH